MTEFLKVAEDRKYSQADKSLAEQTKDAILKARKFFEVSHISIFCLIIPCVESCES